VRREELAWAAGLFEGEGCFSAGSPYGQKAQLAMTDEDVVRRFHRVVGFGNVHEYTQKVPDRKPMFWWRAHSFENFQALVAMLWPWLGERRRERAIVILTRKTK
jgi:hypothetical protein